MSELVSKTSKEYRAIEIISYTSDSVRFIDAEGKERFESGYKVKIKRIR